MTIAEVKPYPLSIAAYRVLGEAGLIPENTELLYGQVYRKMSKSPIHSALVRYLARLIRAACPPDFFVDTEQPLSCAGSEPEPDICVIRGNEEDYWHEHPCSAELVVEVCITSHEYERMKLPAYAIAGVKECWLVYGLEKRIEVFSNPIDGRFQNQRIFNIGSTVQSAQLPRLSVSLEDLFAKAR